jgi:5-methyltetrahydrofolate--homocysteine methyltransferase
VRNGHFYALRCLEALGIQDTDEGIIRISLVHYNTEEEVSQAIGGQTKRGFYTLMGNPVDASMQQLRDAGAAAVGANCSLGSESMIGLAGQIRQSVDIPVLIQPNAGIPQTGPDGTAFYPEDEIYFAENIKKIKALGVDIVGGCCGTTPAFIQKIRESI